MVYLPIFEHYLELSGERFYSFTEMKVLALRNQTSFKVLLSCGVDKGEGYFHFPFYAPLRLPLASCQFFRNEFFYLTLSKYSQMKTVERNFISYFIIA